MLAHPSLGRSTRKRRGFTLIELIVVIAIIALLVWFLTPIFRSIRNFVFGAPAPVVAPEGRNSEPLVGESATVVDDAKPEIPDLGEDLPSRTEDSAKPPEPPGPPTAEQLITQLNSSLTKLQTNETHLLDAIKQYRVELAKKTADLRNKLARAGQTLEQIRLATDAQTAFAESRRLDRRCGELRVYLGRLDEALIKVRVLVDQHQALLVDLPTRQKVNELVDSQLLSTAAQLVSTGSQENELSPERILESPENAVLMEQANQATAAALASTVLPVRPEKSLEDLPKLPELKFEIMGAAEQFLLDDLNELLTTGKTTASTHLTEGRAEAAIETLHGTLDRVHRSVDAFPMTPPLKWRGDCVKLLDETRSALSKQLAAPYLTAFDDALKSARLSKNWNTPLDLLEALVRIAPKAPELPEKVATLAKVLEYRKNVDDLDAAVAAERLREIQAALGMKLNPVELPVRAAQRPTPRLPIGPSERLPAPAPTSTMRQPFRLLKTAIRVFSHSNSVYSVAFSPDGLTLATGSSNNPVKLWDMASGNELRNFRHSDEVYSVAFSPDGLTLATGSNDKTAKLWEVTSGKELRTLYGHGDWVRSVAFSPDGLTLATGSDDKTAKLWEVTSGKEIRTLSEHSSTVRSVAFSPDGLTLATTGGYGNTVQLWGVASGKELSNFRHSDEVYSVVFSPDGLTLATGSSNNPVKLWDMASGKEIRTLSKHSSTVRSVAFSPDGLTLATGSDDGFPKLWDVASGKELRTLYENSSSVRSVAFSPDGLTLATGSKNGTAELSRLRYSTSSSPIDWSETAPSLPPRPVAQMNHPESVYAGEIFQIELSITNSGKGDLVQLAASLDDFNLSFGRVVPSETPVQQSLLLLIPVDYPDGLVSAPLTFTERYGFTPANREIQFKVLPLPRHDFPVVIELKDDDTGLSVGDGDQLFEPSEAIDVGIGINNLIGRDLADLSVMISEVEPGEHPLGVNTRSAAISELKTGTTAQEHLGITIPKDTPPGTRRFQLTVTAASDETFARQIFELTVSP